MKKKNKIALNKKGATVKATEPVPTIKGKDVKILWSRAAGRCAMPDCRRMLTFDKTKGGATLGAMCHIVGEKEDAARGKSPLNLAERNSYSNLILLCSHHHDVIDGDEDKYRVEVLHQIKSEHELWVNEELGGGGANPDELVYATLIDTISTVLKLEKWIWWCDHAVRDLLHEDSLDGTEVLRQIQVTTLWPGKRKALENTINELIDSYCRYIDHYMSNAESRLGGFFGPDKSYARFQNPKYHEFTEKEERWSVKNFWLLCDYTCKLNNFAAEVRKNVNPMFFRLQGRFVVVDSLGFHFGGRSTYFTPIEKGVQVELRKLK